MDFLIGHCTVFIKGLKSFLNRTKLPGMLVRFFFAKYLLQLQFVKSLITIFSRYKPEEDSIILDFMRKNQNQGDETFVNSKDRKFADLALILRRTRASVWRRYKVLQKKQEKKKTRDRDSDILSDSY